MGITRELDKESLLNYYPIYIIYRWSILPILLWQPLVVKLIEVQAINLKGGYRYRNHKRTQQGVSAELLPIYINYRWSVLLIINPTLKSMHCP